MKNHTKILLFITFYTKFWLVRIRFNKVNGYIRIYDRARYLLLFRPEKYDAILNRVRYPTGVKSGITCVTYYNCAKIIGGGGGGGCHIPRAINPIWV